MNDLRQHQAVVLANNTIVNIRQAIAELRSGSIQSHTVELLLSRAVMDMASLIDLVQSLQKNEKDISI